MQQAPAGDGLTRRERRTQETRRAIIDAARDLFEAEGYAETTVDQIAVRADVAPRTFFRYFPTKESLLFAEFDEVRCQMLDALEARPTEEHPIDSLSIVLEELIGVVEERRDDLAWGFRMCEEHEVGGVYERTIIKEQTHERISAFLADRLGVDQDTDPRPLAWTMAAMGVLGATLKAGARASERRSAGDTVRAFDEALRSTADALLRCADVRAAR